MKRKRKDAQAGPTEGGVEDKRRRERDYREQVLALYRGGAAMPNTREYEQAIERQRSLAIELKEFWTAGGHDMMALRDLLRSVDAEVASVIAK